MYNLESSEYLSSLSKIEKNAEVFNISDSDQESDSTIILETNARINKTDKREGESTCLGRADTKSGPNSVECVSSTSNTLSINENFMYVDKPATSNYSRTNSFASFNYKADPELESILLKYGGQSLNHINPKQDKPERIVADNKNSELVELSSDEDDELPRIQIKTTSKLTVINNPTETNINGASKTMRNKSPFYYSDTDEKLHQVQPDNRRSRSVIINGDVAKVNTEQFLNEPTQSVDKKSSWNNTKTTNTPRASYTEANNDHVLNKYKTVFKDNGTIPSATHPASTSQKEKSCESPKRKRKLNSDDKMEKANIKAKKREEAEKDKILKQAFLTANKNIKPEECIKFMTVLLDSEIASEKYGDGILNALQTANITYQLQSQLIPFTVTWNRKVETHLMNNDKELITTTDDVEATEVLLIIQWKEIAEMVHNRSLITHIKSLQSILVNKKLSLAIYGMENYFKYQKSKKQKTLQSEITGASQNSKNRYDKIYKHIAKITKKQLEFALTELQLLCSCCYRTVETAEDLGAMIFQFTKSIAQIPYKLERQRKQQEEEWYISGDNKDCVQVDKNGNGLQRLWQQQLTTFPLARLEHAEAISTKYPTPTSLMEKYKSTESGETLLQDIPIRRAAGPLTTVRKIGPELSKKIYKFFTSTDGNVIL